MALKAHARASMMKGEHGLILGAVLQELGKTKLQSSGADIRVEVPGPRDPLAPCAPKSSPVLTPGKASPKRPSDLPPRSR